MVCVVLVLWSMVCNAKSVDSELVVHLGDVGLTLFWDECFSWFRRTVLFFGWFQTLFFFDWQKYCVGSVTLAQKLTGNAGFWAGFLPTMIHSKCLLIHLVLRFVWLLSTELHPQGRQKMQFRGRVRNLIFWMHTYVLIKSRQRL